jgi:hypothetical protein
LIEMLPLIERQARCLPLIELERGVVDKNCPEIKEVVSRLSLGFLLAGIGLTLTGFFICACWRKLVKQSEKSKKQDKNKVAPGGGDGAGASGGIVAKGRIMTADGQVYEPVEQQPAGYYGPAATL